jgi:hypothetical protein
MKLSRSWSMGVVAAIVGAIAVVATACAGSQTVTLTPQTITVTPKVSQTLTLQADTVISAAGVKNPADICVQSSRFPQGEGVVWRIKVYDPVTGQPMDDKALGSVVVSLKDGQTFKAAYGGHPGQPGVPATDYFWSTAWAIPATYPTGSVPYTVTATGKDGRIGTFNEFNVAPSLLLVVAAQ